MPLSIQLYVEMLSNQLHAVQWLFLGWFWCLVDRARLWNIIANLLKFVHIVWTPFRFFSKLMCVGRYHLPYCSTMPGYIIQNDKENNKRTTSNNVRLSEHHVIGWLLADVLCDFLFLAFHYSYWVYLLLCLNIWTTNKINWPYRVVWAAV